MGKNVTSSWGHSEACSSPEHSINKWKHSTIKLKLAADKLTTLHILKLECLPKCGWIIQILASSNGSRVSPACLTTKQCILWNRKFVSNWGWCCVNAQIKLLTEVLSCPKLSPQVPHSHIVKRNIDSSPWLRIYLNKIKNKKIKYRVGSKGGCYIWLIRQQNKMAKARTIA